MERRFHVIDTGALAPNRWPSIAVASAELRRPRHLHAVRDGDSASTRAAARAHDPRAPLGRERR
jgi:hypothetical protein